MLGLGQAVITPSVPLISAVAPVRAVMLSKDEAGSFAASSAALVTYLTEHMGTARVFCVGKDVALMASLVAAESSRVKKEIASGQTSFTIPYETVLSSSYLAECSMSVVHHLDLIKTLAMVGYSLSISSLLFLDLPVLAFVGGGLSTALQAIGPIVKLPLIE